MFDIDIDNITDALIYHSRGTGCPYAPSSTIRYRGNWLARSRRSRRRTRLSMEGLGMAIIRGSTRGFPILVEVLLHILELGNLGNKGRIEIIDAMTDVACLLAAITRRSRRRGTQVLHMCVCRMRTLNDLESRFIVDS